MIRIRQKKAILPLAFAVVAVIAVSFLFSSCSKEETYRLVKINSYDGEVSVQIEMVKPVNIYSKIRKGRV